MRPDEVGIGTQEENGTVEAQVLVTEPLGGDMLVDVALGSSKLLVKTKPDFGADMGMPCYLRFDTRRWHLFAKDTGLAYF